MKTYRCNQSYTFTDNAAAAAVTITLPTTNAAEGWLIDSIWVYALGAVLTVFDVQVFKNDGTTTIARIGGQVTAGALSLQQPILGPIACAAADGAKVVLTATGATAVQCTVNARKAGAI